MRKALSVALITATLLVGNAAVVAAADLCWSFGLESSNGGTILLNTLVLKDLSVPGKGACKETRGFYVGGPLWVTGMACGSSDGERITFVQTGLPTDGRRVITDKFDLSRATLSGFGTECSIPEGDESSCYHERAVWISTPCVPRNMPVP